MGERRGWDEMQMQMPSTGWDEMQMPSGSTTTTTATTASGPWWWQAQGKCYVVPLGPVLANLRFSVSCPF